LRDLKFVLDTGATHSIVDEKVARRLGVGLRPRQIFDFNKPANLIEGTFSEVTFLMQLQIMSC
jgi:gag-polyprotein putative aspartyl protease